MKIKDVVIVFLGTALLVSLIFLITGLKEESSSGESKKTTQAQSGDTMSDHHSDNPSDSSAFKGLVGKEAPDFTLEDYQGEKIALSGLKGKNVILFFNEGLMCYPACWNQVAAFGKDAELKQEATILNIVTDPKEDWKQAVEKMPELGAAVVLFDSEKTVSKGYGVLSLPSSMHKGQFPGHTYVIIDKEGIVRFTRDDVQMAVRNKELSQELTKINL